MPVRNTQDLGEATLRLARCFSAPGPPAAGSAAAATGALAGALLEWTAGLSATRGPRAFRRRARVIASRAVALQAALGAAAGADAGILRRWLRERDPRAAAELGRAAVGSVLEVATRCAQVAALAAEVARGGHPPARSDAAAALRLAASASECALELAEENLRAPGAAERGPRRRIDRTRDLLQRARSRRGGRS